METKRKKVLFLITQSSFGGAQKYVFDLATNLDRDKYETAVAAGGDGELFDQLKNTDVAIFKLKHLIRPIRPFRDIKAYFEIKKILKEWRPDVLHLNSSKAGILGSLAARNIKIDFQNKIKKSATPDLFNEQEKRPGNNIRVVYTVHGAVFEAAFCWLNKKIFLWLEKLTAKYKDKIICVSEHDRQIWLKYKAASPEKLVTIHNGINLNISFLSKEEARKELFLMPSLKNLLILPSLSAKESKSFFSDKRNELPAADYKIIGSITHLYPEKNLETLINAASLILNNPQQQENILFLIIGSGPQEQNLKLKIEKLKLSKKILLTGAIPAANKYLKAFDVFVLPSIKEGLPYAILEAMAAGLPIVSSAVGGVPEIIEDNDNGFLISAKDHEALAARLTQILQNPTLAQKFSQKSLIKIKAFGLEKMIEKTQKQY